MKSGSRELQKRMEKQVPRMGGELKKEWFERVAEFYTIDIIKAENLYYREGHSIPNETYIKLRNLDHPVTPSEKRLAESLNRREEIKDIIRVHTDEITKQVMHNLVQSLSESMARLSS